MTKDDLLRLADLRIRESEMLVKNGFPDSSFYLAGYSIELLLKARICSLLELDDFFAFDKARKEFYRPFKTHDFYELVILAGLYKYVYGSERVGGFDLISTELDSWSEQSRYSFGQTITSASLFLEAVKQFEKWIKKLF